ncbi:MAG: hypothetical protein DMF95_24435 [Acidobacteria bacterium]|nr:MAG: hypothetical protein DMF95_24435 [Acidobacteriota bacterium]
MPGCALKSLHGPYNDLNCSSSDASPTSSARVGRAGESCGRPRRGDPLALILLALVLVQTGWAKNRLRDLIVREANRYLAATLTVGRLDGSIFRGLQLGDISLDRNGHALVRIEEVSLTYSIRELFQRGVVIRSVRLMRPYVAGARLPDGRWDLAALIKRESRDGGPTGPGRSIEIQSIEVIDGRVSLRDSLEFGALHTPTDFESLNASISFAYYPVGGG